MRLRKLDAQMARPTHGGWNGWTGGSFLRSPNTFLMWFSSWLKRMYTSTVLRWTALRMFSRLARNEKASRSSTPDSTVLMISKAEEMTLVIITSRSLVPFLYTPKSPCHSVPALTSRMLYFRFRRMFTCFSKDFWMSTSDLAISGPRVPPKHGTEDSLPPVLAAFPPNWICPSQTSRRSLQRCWTKASTSAKMLVSSISHGLPLWASR
mmetsp:Transcript_145723/g.254351  ORF Transcript_145723/g.254351 Transcript_145723/m.254351 type:complete len:208 (+) Transcript_145723:5020-5643(+)